MLLLMFTFAVSMVQSDGAIVDIAVAKQRRWRRHPVAIAAATAMTGASGMSSMVLLWLLLILLLSGVGVVWLRGCGGVDEIHGQ